jgi:ketosteroid isomerase-like protein
MSQENVEALRSMFALVGDGDNREAIYELLDPDVELVIPADDLDAGHYFGHVGVRGYLLAWAGTWDVWHFHAERLIDVGDGRVVVDLSQTVRGRGSGVEVRASLGQVFTFRDGLVVRWDNFGTFAEALEAVGLRA